MLKIPNEMSLQPKEVTIRNPPRIRPSPLGEIPKKKKVSRALPTTSLGSRHIAPHSPPKYAGANLSVFEVISLLLGIFECTQHQSMDSPPT